jgi:hypothetical protein
MNETHFVPLRAIRASEGTLQHEKHEGYVIPRVSCQLSCTGLEETRD